MAKLKKNKIICPECRGNGYVKIPYQQVKEEVITQCGVCDSEGEVDSKDIDGIVVDCDGINYKVHRLQ